MINDSNITNSPKTINEVLKTKPLGHPHVENGKRHMAIFDHLCLELNLSIIHLRIIIMDQLNAIKSQCS